MSRIRLLGLVLLGLGLTLAPAALAGTQQYSASWIADSFGNDKVGGTGASEFFEVFAIPAKYVCNPYVPRCNFDQTPTKGTPMGKFNPLGGAKPPAPANACRNLSTFGSPGDPCVDASTCPTARPAKGYTRTVNGNYQFNATDRLSPYARRYRNPYFFSGNNPRTTYCTAISTVGGGNATMYLTVNNPLRGPVQKGGPLTGNGTVNTTAPGAGGKFSFAAAPATPMNTGTLINKNGFRRTTQGEFGPVFPYVYSYTYVTWRNSAGTFSQGGGFFPSATENATTVSIPYITGYTGMGDPIIQAGIKVTKGTNNFGGVMRLLGQMDTKVCYFNKNGCNLGGANWLYDVVGTAGVTNATLGIVTQGLTTSGTEKYYHTVLETSSIFTVKGERFPWTTGTVTLTALGRGPHKTFHVRKGDDNRTVTYGKGTVQLVSPILTHWLVPSFEFETGGVAILQLQFLPEPSKWMMLLAGLSMLGVLYRYRGR